MRPNILLLMTDQHRADLMGSDNRWGVRTPHLNRLLEQGISFTNTYCNSPICVPSRMSMMTGLFVHHHEAYDNCTSLAVDYPTFAHALTAAGYDTVICARTHFNGADAYHGFEHRLATDMNNPIEYGAMPAQWTGPLAPRWGGVRPATEKPYETSDSPTLMYDDYVCDQACDFLRSGRDDERPFMLMASFYGPHPMVSNREIYRSDYEKYLDGDLRCEELTPEAFEALPAHERRKLANASGKAVAPDSASIRRFRAEYFSRVTYTDALLGRVVEALEQAGLADNTIIIYVSDHGEQMGEHGVFGKSSFFEGTARVPLVISMPDRRSGIVEHNVQLVDLFPTLCDMVGRGPVAHTLDGRSLMPLVRDPSASWDDLVFSEFYDAKAWRPNYMLKQGPWKFCHYPGEQDFLHNLEQDPGEVANLALDAAYGDRLAAMRRELFTRWNPPELEARARQRQAMRRELLAATNCSVQTKQRIKQQIKVFRDAWNEPYWDDNQRQSAHEAFLS